MIRRWWCALRGHVPTNEGLLFIEESYITVAFCSRCGFGL